MQIKTIVHRYNKCYCVRACVRVSVLGFARAPRVVLLFVSGRRVMLVFASAPRVVLLFVSGRRVMLVFTSAPWVVLLFVKGFWTVLLFAGSFVRCYFSSASERCYFSYGASICACIIHKFLYIRIFIFVIFVYSLNKMIIS